MKKIFLFVSFTIVVGMTNAFAGRDPNVSTQVLQSFKKEFPAAAYLKWDKYQDYFRATFVLNDHRTEAWFSSEGELLGTVRDLLFDQLPLTVMKNVGKKFPAAYFYEVREVSNTNGTTYQMVAGTKKAKYKLSATPDGEVTKAGKIKN